MSGCPKCGHSPEQTLGELMNRRASAGAAMVMAREALARTPKEPADAWQKAERQYRTSETAYALALEHETNREIPQDNNTGYRAACDPITVPHLLATNLVASVNLWAEL